MAELHRRIRKMVGIFMAAEGLVGASAVIKIEKNRDSAGFQPEFQCIHA
jgi:hypothetical protein